MKMRPGHTIAWSDLCIAACGLAALGQTSVRSHPTLPFPDKPTVSLIDVRLDAVRRVADN
jgi:hypothetical protein